MRAYRALGRSVHVVGPDGVVLCISDADAADLGRQLVEAAEGPDAR